MTKDHQPKVKPTKAQIAQWRADRQARKAQKIADKLANIVRPRTVGIYELLDPRDGKPFYIGQAVNPDRRLLQHLAMRPKATTRERIADIIASGEKPTMRVIRQFTGTPNECTRAEQFEQRKAIDAGFSLLLPITDENAIRNLKAKHDRT